MATQARSTSSAMPSSTSAISSLPLPPPVSSSQPRPSRANPRVTPVGSSYLGSGVVDQDPVLISNRDIMSMFTDLRNQLGRMEQGQDTLRRDVDGLRSRVDAPQVTTPLRSRILDFSTPPSTHYSGDFMSMQSSAGASVPINSTSVSVSRDLGMASGSRVPGSNDGNVSSGFTTGTNILQDPGISPVMAKELQKLKDMISSVPGVVPPIPEVAPTAHKVSRFAPPICDAEIPKRFQTPSMKLYDGTTDPEEHIAQYRERMEIVPIPADLKEACLCKGFGATLTGSALKWLLNVPPYSITSFAHLVNLFNTQFSCSRTFERLTTDLYRVVQKPNESLRDFVGRFGRESLGIPNLDMPTAVQAFKSVIRKDSPFYEDLVMNPCRNLDEVRNRALRFIRLEEDAMIQKMVAVPSTYDRPNRKMESSSSRSNRGKPYTRNEDRRIHAVEEEDRLYPKITDYCFAVDTPGILCAMQDLGDKVRWPKKNDKPAVWKDKSKWCAYHEDFGHITENCMAFRKEISHLLNQGYLKELFDRRKNRQEQRRDPEKQDPSKIPQRARSPPPDAKVINFISGGSDICGTSYSAAKRHAKESRSEKPEKPLRSVTLKEEKLVTFSEDDKEDVQDPHHDGLVITLYVANHFVRRILIDGGSSVNIIQLATLKLMGIPESEITTKSTVLVGFSGEVKNTVGEIKLPVYIEGVNSLQRFCVIDSLSCYNIILGRPWIHDMKAVPSTYHQCVKLPTPWGVVRINSDQQEAKDCYMTSMKSTTQPRSA